MVKQLIVLAGGNGSGKSTFFDKYLRHLGIHFINADELARAHFPGVTAEDSKKAQDLARKQCEEYLATGKNFCFETVFSHESKIELIKQAKEKGYQVELVYLHLVDVQLNQARVFQRVNNGGHPVPFEKVASRIPKTIENIKQALSIVDSARLLDNSNGQNPFVQIARIEKQKLDFVVSPIPDWAKFLLEQFLQPH